ncbi:tram-like protein [Campylobacter sp. CCS1377]|uniref:Tram-like protein n=1 Tax=Campylobacter sp. CCS1377 TaxID=3158229 RepID=A0AAU7E9I4_9BACT
MNNFNDYLQKHKLFLQIFDLSKLTRKKNLICHTTQNHLIFQYTGKTRFLLKDALNLKELSEKILSSEEKILILHTNAPLCSKAKNYLINEGFLIL